MRERIKHLRVAWWNTSLNPPIKRKCVKCHVVRHDVSVVLGQLLKKYDLVFVGEFKDEITAGMALKGCSGWAYMPLSGGPDNGPDMNLGLFYKLSYCRPLQPLELKVYTTIPNLRRKPLSLKYRIGIRICVGIIPLGHFVEFFVLHWRNYAEANSDFIKDSAALSLCNYMQLNSDFILKVCLGDFNVEPWSSSLSKLCSSRSRRYIKEIGGFYNPFWAHLVEDEGSLCYPEHVRHLADYLMFDQILLYHGFWDAYEVKIKSFVERPKGLVFKKGCHAPVGVKLELKERSE